MCKGLDVMIHNFRFKANYNWFPRKEAIKDYKSMKEAGFFDELNDVPDQFKTPVLVMKLLPPQLIYMHMKFGIRIESLNKWANKIMDIYNTELIETVEVKQKLESLINE
jgi:hypothetical protein